MPPYGLQVTLIPILPLLPPYIYYYHIATKYQGTQLYISTYQIKFCLQVACPWPSARAVVRAPPPTTFKVLKASLAESPSLTGQSVSYAVLQYPAGSINPPHTHPRSAKLLFLLGGALEVGFIDTTNKLFTQVLQAGDLFVFPKGFVHYQFNSDANSSAFAISAFGSANAGIVSDPTTVFTTSIDDAILAKSFKTDVAAIQKLKAGLAPNA